ncbi:hypothetical protein AbraIFM66951_004115 [Aspergillus brasiliensis]|uniref:FAD-binding domain-containing protein n=1 Tax=Aspergillus brasiliensis TaxID=319629 RepID=A0A9W5YVT3_9EURO|nr:hypothetical protein AbraCBS73388_011697 [Aspergillus brasiliensis]GKZ50751.1 hypothetical protein AbraIFM66951_004115 [Aspergillus brasiliensis]
MTESKTIEIAIIGSGLIGTLLALGLLNIPSPNPTGTKATSTTLHIKIYEQSSTPHELGAGIGFTTCARKCMTLMDPRIADCVARVATLNGEPEASTPDYCMRFVDGFRTYTGGDCWGTTAKEEGEKKGVDIRGVGSDRIKVQYDHSKQDKGSEGEEGIYISGKAYKLYAGPRGFEGCHRGQFLEEVMKLMPDGVVECSKRVEGYEVLPSGRIQMQFGDGGRVECDLVLACDGIKSLLRNHLFPQHHPQYTHQFAFRGLVPMSTAVSKLGRYRALRQHMHCGPRAHVLHFPVAKQQLMNVVAFVQDANDWTHHGMTAPAKKSEVVEAFKEWGPFVRAVIDLLPEQLDKWAVFDTFDSPVPKYTEGRVALVGDAAHASSPHHGAGAGMGVEDALALVTALQKAREDVDRGVEVSGALEAAVKAYSRVRYERSQWLVRSSREVGWTYEWMNEDVGADMDRAFADIKERSHRVWYFDVEAMVAEVERQYRWFLWN